MTVLEIIKKLNIRKGYSPVYGECKISVKNDDTAIIVSKGENHLHFLKKDGKILPEGECLIFPSKDNRDWNDFYWREKVRLLPENTPVMVSNCKEDWSLRYYKTDRICSLYKENNNGTVWAYIVPVSKFDFKANKISTNIKNSI